MSEEKKQMLEPLTYKQLKVKALLLTEIIAFRRTNKCPDLETRKDNNFQTTEDSLSECDSSTEIFMHNGIIYSSQHYNSGPDPDMSDIAVAFYKILYRKDILNDYNGIKDKSFAGDTMNSYNSVAEQASNGKCREWYFRYHCLANFWLIPYEIGRKSRKWSKYDSLDIFLIAVGNNDPKRNENKRTNLPYFNNFRTNDEIDYSKFLEFHYLTNYKTISEDIDEINNMYKTGVDPDKIAGDIIDQMIECIELRADNIVRDEEVCNELYDFFKDNNLL